MLTSRRTGYQSLAWPGLPGWAWLVAGVALLCLLAGCGSRPVHHARYKPSRYYAPPGPSSDPWGPYIHEASGRFGVPERWIRRVMRQESGGQEDVISWAGAMGLMQVMPDTYDDLRGRYALGDDPFDPHNNILAGTAYLREMYDRFGAPGFLAAYNAGPNRMDRYLNYGSPLPDETINYVASIAPGLGPETPMSGPLAAYGRGSGRPSQYAARQANGCDPDAAYDPTRPCAPVASPAVQQAVFAVTAPAGVGCDADAAYDPTRPCAPAIRQPEAASVDPCDPDAAYDPRHVCRPPAAVLAAAGAPARVTATPLAPIMTAPPVEPARPGSYAVAARPPLQESTSQRLAFTALPVPGRPALVAGAWGIQVGAFANLASAEAAAENARMAMPDLLQTAKVELPPTTPFGGRVAFRARLTGLTSIVATDACARLNSRGTPCLPVPPGRDTL